MAWPYVVAGTIVFLVAAVVLASRRSSAGITTSRLGRTLRLAYDSARMTLRLLRRRMSHPFMSNEQRIASERDNHERNAREVLETMGNMKGALMKLGQIASFMDESLPAAYQEQLTKLQTQAPPMSYKTVVSVFVAELGKEPEAIFSYFEMDPLAAASIGQVHRARLPSGEDVVVKIQYPGVGDAISADLSNAGLILGAIGFAMPNIDARPIADEMRERLIEELDYQREAKNQTLFGEMFSGHDDVFVPRVFEKFSSARILTSEFVEGIGFYDFIASADDDDKKRAVLTLRKFVFDSLYFHHVFNGDPHPGNYLFMPDGRIAFLDFGCVKHFDPKFMDDFRELNRRYLLGDKDGYFAKACEMGFVRSGYEDRVTKEWLWDYAKWFYMPVLLEEQPFRFTPAYCKQALGVLFGENMKYLSMPPEYLMLNRITFGLNSILSRLDACEDWRTLSMPYYFPEGFAAASEV
jgi:predicted unusual protein kinase regulating ubiquinone biosynthesis (AarF/ABC1/UbiB family)